MNREDSINQELDNVEKTEKEKRAEIAKRFQKMRGQKEPKKPATNSFSHPNFLHRKKKRKYPNLIKNTKMQMKEFCHKNSGVPMEKFRPIPFHLKSIRKHIFRNPFLNLPSFNSKFFKKKSKSFNFGKPNCNRIAHKIYKEMNLDQNNLNQTTIPKISKNLNDISHLKTNNNFLQMRGKKQVIHSRNDLNGRNLRNFHGNAFWQQPNNNPRGNNPILNEISRMSFKANTKINGILFLYKFRFKIK